MNAQFEVGQTYTCRSLLDHDVIIAVTVAKRTPKTITTVDGASYRIALFEGVEFVKPNGAHSMAPTIWGV